MVKGLSFFARKSQPTSFSIDLSPCQTPETQNESQSFNFTQIAEKVIQNKSDIRIKKMQSPIHVRNSSRLNASAKQNVQIQS